MFNIPFIKKKEIPKNSVGTRVEDIRLIVGLGNPGQKYENTYHNAGFLFIDSMMSSEVGDERGESPKWKSLKSFRYSRVGQMILTKPNTFMNESGDAVKKILKYFDVGPEEILVIHDDSDFKLGEYKFMLGRGSAGHKGVESIINSIGTKDFYRVRIGIRKMGGKANGFVLGKIGKDDRLILDKVFEEISETISSGKTSK